MEKPVEPKLVAPRRGAKICDQVWARGSVCTGNQEMLGFDAASGTLTIPIWAAGAASAVFVVALVLASGRAGATALISTLFRIAIVAIVVYGGFIYLQRATLQDRVAERRSLDERSVALMGRSMAPG